MRVTFLYALGLMAIVSVAALPSQGRAEDDARGYSCEFTSGVSGTYAGGAFTSKPTSAIKFTIESINLATQSAVLHGDGGAAKGKLSIARAIGANHFLEIANEGYWNITTVYDRDPQTGTSPAVHSRHLGVVGQPIFAQYTGTCKAAP